MPDNEGTITVCIGNYGYYNEGELRDKWITLPKTDVEIQQFLTDNGYRKSSIRAATRQRILLS